MKWQIIWLMLFASCAGCQRDLPTITHVKVLDKNFETVAVVDDPETLGTLNSIWQTFTATEPSTRPPFSYKVDFTFSDGSGGRWLYDPKGNMTVLSKAKVPIYTFERTEELRRILVPQQEAEGDGERRSAP